MYFDIPKPLTLYRHGLHQHSSTSCTISDLADLQSKHNVLSHQIGSWQGIQDVHMLQVAQLCVAKPEHPVGLPPIKPEDIKLWLPSSVLLGHPSLSSLLALQAKKQCLHLAQMSDSLEDIHQILASITEFKKLNVSGTGQHAVTWTLSVYERFLMKQEQCTE